ncbi:hypothetical protein EVAR_36098_1 [Eumeta japonica]|uniref:Uncharacterized protein n=1 Tax=Eumeta variegata TaxID=151549 RepID=A0A4C1YJB6_EUMVA|nr:hypothetical protein EVAR_36098_1 [Eumeta japonica]
MSQVWKQRSAHQRRRPLVRQAGASARRTCAARRDSYKPIGRADASISGRFGLRRAGGVDPRYGGALAANGPSAFTAPHHRVVNIAGHSRKGYTTAASGRERTKGVFIAARGPRVPICDSQQTNSVNLRRIGRHRYGVKITLMVKKYENFNVPTKVERLQYGPELPVTVIYGCGADVLTCCGRGNGLA